MRVIENDYLDFARDTPNAKRISYNHEDGRRTKRKKKTRKTRSNVSARRHNCHAERNRGRTIHERNTVIALIATGDIAMHVLSTFRNALLSSVMAAD